MANRNQPQQQEKSQRPQPADPVVQGAEQTLQAAKPLVELMLRMGIIVNVAAAGVEGVPD